MRRQTVRRHSPRCQSLRSLALLAVLTLPLAACQSVADVEADLDYADDQRCREFGLRRGTAAYAQCRNDLERNRILAAQQRRPAVVTTWGVGPVWGPGVGVGYEYEWPRRPIYRGPPPVYGPPPGVGPRPFPPGPPPGVGPRPFPPGPGPIQPPTTGPRPLPPPVTGPPTLPPPATDRGPFRPPIAPAPRPGTGPGPGPGLGSGGSPTGGPLAPPVRRIPPAPGTDGAPARPLSGVSG
jgi:hypothetical protein